MLYNKKGSIRVCILDLFVSFNLHRLVYFKDNSHLKKKKSPFPAYLKKYIIFTYFYLFYLSPPRGRMKIDTTIHMCEQKCISEQYSNRANLLKREIEGILKNLYITCIS